jgi:hypothetical protein
LNTKTPKHGISTYKLNISTNPSSTLTQMGRVILAIKALKLGHFQSIQAAAKAYGIHHTTLRNRINRMPS